jgi:hypothetical protein
MSKSRTRGLLPSTKEMFLDDCLAVVGGAYRAARGEVPELPGSTRFGGLFAFTKRESQQLTSLRDLIVRYVGQSSPPRPLCLAVFGPPGSGKSFAVKQICLEARMQPGMPEKLKLPVTVVNMTQVSDPTDLGRVFARIAGEQDEDTVPIVFVDEFDAPRGSAPYGWLAWFLAPMHDGEFLHEGAIIRLKRAVFVFAGGTAATMDDFANFRKLSAFQFAKGPDFVSRLRGFLDVQGPNAWPRERRRALLLRNELQERVSRDRRGKPTAKLALTPDRGMLEALLLVGRYRHGARSIAALIELSSLTADQKRFRWADLPEDHLLRLHIDRGALDAKRIGGSVALSGYQVASKLDRIANCWLAVAGALWREGATLSYGGSWGVGKDGTLMRSLADELVKKVVEPSRDERRRKRPAPWLESFLKDDTASIANANRAISRRSQERCGVRLVSQNYLNHRERLELNNDEWMIRMVERFRRRLAVTQASVAMFAIAGATKGHLGRVPGVAEEVMLALALKRPVYIAGGFGGAAVDVGGLLGLGRPSSGELPRSMRAQPQEPDILRVADKLRPAPLSKLPVTSHEIASFLKDHALGGPDWPKNGLNAEENRILFESKDGEKIARLVVKGLEEVFAEEA